MANKLLTICVSFFLTSLLCCQINQIILNSKQMNQESTTNIYSKLCTERSCDRGPCIVNYYVLKKLQIKITTSL